MSEAKLEGPPLTAKIDTTYEGGQLRRARFLEKDGTVLVDAHFADGKLHGPFMWNVARQIMFHHPVITFDGTAIYAKDLKLPKPHPKSLEVEFVRGKLAKGKKSSADDAALADWGQRVTKAELTGYIERGDLARDLGAFFAGAKAVEAGAPREDWIQKLPAAHRPAAMSFDALVRGGKFPALPVAMDLSTYGFDCAGENLPGAADPRYVGLSSDGSGNMHLLDTESGEVLGWEHEQDGFDERRSFASLDAYAFAMIRVAAAAQGRIDKKQLAAAFKKLGLRAGAFELTLV